MDAEPTHAVPMRQRLEDKLRANLKIEHLVSRSAELYGQKLTQQDIVDTSGNCGSSFALTIVSPDFAKKMTLARHKMSKYRRSTGGSWTEHHS